MPVPGHWQPEESARDGCISGRPAKGGFGRGCSMLTCFESRAMRVCHEQDPCQPARREGLQTCQEPAGKLLQSQAIYVGRFNAISKGGSSRPNPSNKVGRSEELPSRQRESWMLQCIRHPGVRILFCPLEKAATHPSKVQNVGLDACRSCHAAVRLPKLHVPTSRTFECLCRAC